MPITPEHRARLIEAAAAARSIAQAARDFRSVIATGIPDPEAYSRLLSLDLAALLTGASHVVGSYIVHHSRIHELRSLGLVEFGGNSLTAFGIKVRKALKEEDA